MSSKRKTASKTNAKTKTATAKAKTTAKPKTTKKATTAKAKTKAADNKTTAKTKPNAKSSNSALAKAVAVVSEVYRPEGMSADIVSHTSMTFTGTHLRANTLAAAIKFPLKTKFKANVNGPTLAKVVNAFESRGVDDIGVSIKDEVMTISSGKSNVEMVVASTDADEVANLSGANEFKVDADTKEKIVTALSQTLQAAGKKDSRTYLNGVHFFVEKGKLILMACDSFVACRVNTGIKGADKFNGLSLTRETVESFIATANLIECNGDTMLITRNKDGKASLFGWRFGNGAEFCSAVMWKSKDLEVKELMDKLKSFNVNKLPSVATPDGLVDAVSEGKIVATKDSAVMFSVKDGVMSLKTGDENRGLVYTTTDIATEIKDTEVSYKLDYLTRLAKNPADKILFFDDGPLYLGNVDIYDNDSVGVQSYAMPVRL